MFNVLFLCTGNSARSILAEVILNDLGAGRFRAHSAGSRPAGAVNTAALRQLQLHGHDAAGVASKSWDRFGAAGSPEFDLVVTVCDSAAREACPVWPGAPVSVHWGIPDPAAVQGDTSTVDAAFAAAYSCLRTRLEALVALPVESLPAAGLKRAVHGIAKEIS
jgi:arsenate reductase